MRTTRLTLGVWAACLFTVPAAAQNVTELYVTPDTLRLEAGQRQGLTVQAFDESGNAILAVKYKVADSAVASVAANGTVAGEQAGRTRITVQAGQKTRSVLVLVTGGPAPASAPVAATTPGPSPTPAPPAAPAAPAPVARLVAEPASVTLLPTEYTRITVRALAADGSEIANPELVWRAVMPAVAALSDSAGTVTALSAGQAAIQVIAGSGVTLSVPVSVVLTEFTLNRDTLILAPQDGDTLRATVPSQSHRLLRPQFLQWTADPAVVEVSPEGVLRALGPGRTDVVVRGFLQERRVHVIVHQRVAHFLVAPRLSEPVQLPVQASREFSLIPQTVDSLPIAGVPITWTVGDTAVASFNPATGMLTARQAGHTTLAFAARGFQPRSWNIEVLPGTVAFDRVRLALRPGERAQLKPSWVDEHGAPVAPATGLSWITSDATIARVLPDGSLEGIAPGRVQVTAQGPSGVPARATVFVTADLLVASTRGGRFGIYALMAGAPEHWLPLVADSSSNSVDAVYSPDRTRLVYSSDRFGAGNFDLVLADADGANPVRLTTETGVDHQPAWTPDGRQIVFASGREGVRQIYLINADGSGARRLTSLPGGAGEPAVSPDGKSVAFTGYPGARDGQSDIYTVPLAGGPAVAVTATAERRESRPFYLPQGELAWVLQRRDRKEPDQVLQRSPAGPGAAPLVSSDLAVTDVALARDGSRIAWVASRPSERNKNSVEFTFQWRSLASGAETSVRLLPGERITSPAF